ncbi:hypothetical protein [Bacillus sp. FSL K6-0993]|uniref:hypothetical protein n=1 Tax=Bacillus sp. FSL K6-0993 TaxID=2921456 RepID=UPI0030EC6A2A
MVQCSKFDNNTKVYVDTQLEGNHEDENEGKSYYDNDSSQESKTLNDKYLSQQEENEKYDIYANDLTTREIKSRNGQDENVYGGNVISSSQAKSYGYHTTPITKEGDKTFKFWRNDCGFCSGKG